MSVHRATPEAETATALFKIAQKFNDEYAQNDVEPVYDRWDLRSQAVISRAEYLRRHLECPAATQEPVRVLSATPSPGGQWSVRYEIGGLFFTDYWYYRGRRWVFDLLLSNPEAVRSYRLSGAKHARANGCRR